MKISTKRLSVTLILGLGFTALCLEGGLRLFASESLYEPDPILGWRAKRDYQTVVTRTTPWLTEVWRDLVLDAGFDDILWPAKEGDKGMDILLQDGFHWSDVGTALFGAAAWRAAAPVLEKAGT